MPSVSPFRALCYAPGLRGELDRLIAPPYDVIGEEQRERLAARHPRNIVHLDLPRPAAGLDAYATAAARLSELVREGILGRDARPAFYVLEQRYRAPSGEERVRRGFFARLRLEPFEAGIVIPHERTLERPRVDRQRLLAATRTHLSAVFLLHPDPGGEAARMMERTTAGEIVLAARDDDGTISRLARLDDSRTMESLAGRLARTWALIADGHHRYESALAYRDARRAAGFRDAEHVLAFFCSLEDRGLSIFPIHRLVHSLGRFDLAAFRRRLEDLFTLAPVDGREPLLQALAARRADSGVFGFVFPGEERSFVAVWKEGAGLDRPEVASVPEPLRRLDVILLHRLVLEGILGITVEAQANQTHLDYVKDDRDLFRRVAEGGAQAGILLNPTRIEQVVEVSRQGLRLPQKSTYFYPKVPTGLVLDPLD